MGVWRSLGGGGGGRGGGGGELESGGRFLRPSFGGV